MSAQRRRGERLRPLPDAAALRGLQGQHGLLRGPAGPARGRPQRPPLARLHRRQVRGRLRGESVEADGASASVPAGVLPWSAGWPSLTSQSRAPVRPGQLSGLC